MKLCDLRPRDYDRACSLGGQAERMGIFADIKFWIVRQVPRNQTQKRVQEQPVDGSQVAQAGCENQYISLRADLQLVQELCAHHE